MVTNPSALDFGHTLLPPKARPIDRSAAELAVGQLRAALGVDTSTEIDVNTPRRVADTYAQMLTQRPWEFTVATTGALQRSATAHAEFVQMASMAGRAA